MMGVHCSCDCVGRPAHAADVHAKQLDTLDYMGGSRSLINQGTATAWQMSSYSLPGATQPVCKQTRTYTLINQPKHAAKRYSTACTTTLGGLQAINSATRAAPGGSAGQHQAEGTILANNRLHRGRLRLEKLGSHKHSCTCDQTAPRWPHGFWKAPNIKLQHHAPANTAQHAHTREAPQPPHRDVPM